MDLTEILSGGEAHLHSYCLVKKDKGLSVERRKDYELTRAWPTNSWAGTWNPSMVRVPPKDESQLNFNTHNGQEFIFILEGRLEVRLDKIRRDHGARRLPVFHAPSLPTLCAGWTARMHYSST